MSTTYEFEMIGVHKSFVTFEPKSHPAPRGLTAHASTSSGSDHTKSQNAPLWGTSWFLSIKRIWSSVRISGESPPCTQRTCSSMRAATVKRSKTRQQYLHALAFPYFV